jgi:putative membrane protein
MLGRTKAALAAASALILAGALDAAPPTPVFVAKAGASDLYERQASQLVAGSTRDPRIRRFANEMIRDHTKSTQMIKAAALRSGLHPRPPKLDWQQKRMITELRRAHGRSRDTVYLNQQQQAHAQALGLMRDYAATGSARALRRAAGEIVPVIRHHIGMLTDIRR